MKSIRNRAYNLTIIAVCILFLICSVTALVSIFKKHIASAQENQEILIDGYDFSDNSVLVTMDKAVGGVNKIHNKSYFGDIAVTSVEDLTYRENVANVDLDRFKQILKLELQYHDKSYVLKAVEKISRINGVEAVTPNYFGEFCATANDPSYSKQWGLADINIESAWDITTGSKAIRVGVIDTGIARHHDLIDNLAQGKNFVDNNFSTNDTVGHGTHVAGIIGAVGDNNTGISGVCKNVELVPLKISDVSRPWKDEYVIKAINYAAELWGTIEQIDLLNFSGGNITDKINIYNAINNFRGLFVCSSGNAGKDIDSSPEYPASFTCDNIITVGAIGSNGNRCEFSNYGRYSVDIYAPGDDIYSTVPYSINSTGYESLPGTSMATPFVTGVAALLLSRNPTLTAAELKEFILRNADNITISTPDGKNQNVKKLNAYESLFDIDDEYYYVTFEQDGFSGPTTLKLKNGDKWPVVTMPTRQAYYLAQYKDLKTGKTYYDQYGLPRYDTVSLTESIFLVGSWVENTYNIAITYKHEHADYASRISGMPARHSETITHTAVESLTENNNTRLFTNWSMILNGEAYYDPVTNPWHEISTKRELKVNLAELVERYYPNLQDAGIIEFRATYATKEDTSSGGSCVAEGMLITLANGEQVPVEQLTGEETLLVWNLFTGTYDTAPILCIDRDSLGTYEVINLYFSDDTQVKVISEHGFWDFNLNKYVYLDANAADYIGHWFNKQTVNENGEFSWTSVQLTDVIIQEEYTAAYSPVTYSHLCYYVNGMLSMPGGIEGLFNIFEVDSQTMSYDKVAMAMDIEQYGLYTYEEFAEILPVPEEIFEAVNGQYLKVAIGKGLIDLDTLENYINQYSALFD